MKCRKSQQLSLYAAWDVADTHLANLFGLNESKYEWAVREYYYQKRMEAEDEKQAGQRSNSQVRLAGTLLIAWLHCACSHIFATSLESALQAFQLV